MHNAPAVIYPVGRSTVLGSFLAVLWLGAMLASISFGWLQQWPLAWGMTALALGCGVWVALWWRWLPTGQLCWDGNSWRWPAPELGHGGTVQVRFDAQYWILIVFVDQVANRPVWIWIEASALRESWLDLRRALVAHTGSAAYPTGSASGVDL